MSSRTSSQLTLKKATGRAERGGNATFRRLVIASSGASLLVVVAGVLVYPATLAGPSAQAGPFAQPAVIGCLVVLLLYLALGVRGPRAVDRAGYVALRRGLFYGRVLGGLWLVQILFLNLYPLNDHVPPALALLVYLGVCGSLTMAGLFSARETGRLSSGALAGLWSGVVGSSLAVGALLLLSYLFSGSLRQNPALDAAFAQSGMPVFQAFVLNHMLHLSFLHLFWFGLLLASGLGALGGLAGRALAKNRIFMLE